ncbi:AraC family transcriptional regulator [Paenibacillus sp.]|uniref:helix-turn-helix transcriptional regulator n=1 Tax=Paenibacillus sp. TaxID=58172 RepID=UPI002D3161A4|nr:AraC family transcriptional regulator [Paenibacillus sp.]HZG55980.1 AraC family transcriptional regulator [Paenibacillus sp.]
MNGILSEASLLFDAPPIPYIVSCGRGSFEPGEHHHDRSGIGVFDLLIIYQGTLFMGENGDEFMVQAGQLLILRPDLHHYATACCTEKTLYYWIHFQTSRNWTETKEDFSKIRLHRLYGLERKHQQDEFTLHHYFIHIPKHYQLPYPANTYNKIERLLALDKQSPTSARWEQQTIFEELLKAVHQEQTLSENRAVVQLAEQIATYLRQNYSEPIRNGLLRERFHFHPNYLARCMKKVFGCTPMEYLLVYRMEKAKQMLLTTVWPVSRIAEETGFNQIPYFIRLFHKYEGIPPQQYRKKFMKR